MPKPRYMRSLLIATAVIAVIAVAIIATIAPSKMWFHAGGTQVGQFGPSIASTAPVLNMQFKGIPLVPPTAADSEKYAALLRKANAGDIEAEVDLTWLIDDNAPSESTTAKITDVLLDIISKRVVDDRTGEKIFLMLGYRSNSSSVRGILCRYPLDRHHSANLNRDAIEALGQLLGPHELSVSHPGRYVPDSQSLQVIRKYLHSSDSRDQLSAVKAVNSGDIQELYSELRLLQQKSVSPDVKRLANETLKHMNR